MSEKKQQENGSGFLSAGMAELKRKWSCLGMRREMKKLEKERSRQLAELGRQSWENGSFAPGSEAIRVALELLGSESNSVAGKKEELDSAIEKCNQQILSDRARLDETLQQAASVRKDAERDVKELRLSIAQHEKDIKTTQTRLASIPDKIEKLKQAKGDSDEGRQTPGEEISQLEQEHQSLTDRLNGINAELESARSTQEEKQATLAAAKSEEARVSAERNRILDENKKKLRELESERKSCDGKKTKISRDMSEQFVELGDHIITSGFSEPAVAETRKAVEQTDSRIDEIRNTIAACREKSRSMPGGTMARFYGVLALVPVLIILLTAGILLISGAPEGQAENTEKEITQQVDNRPEKTEINPYLDHPLKEHPAYRLTDRLHEARKTGDIETAKEEILKLCKALGLGVYTSKGEQVLAGSERSADDFFLYDFMRGILARSYSNHTVTDFNAHIIMMSQVLSASEDLYEYFYGFRNALHQRYSEAAANPNRPESFLPLVIDGLARNQAIPYSLEELSERDTDNLEIDDIQSFLVMLDFYIPPPGKRQAWYQELSDAILPVAHASSLCDRIAGDGAKANWGTGQSIAADVLSHGKGAAAAAGSAVGNANLIASLIGDILILRGIELDITPSRGVVFNLPHSSGDFRDLPTHAFTATATFRTELSEEVIECGWLIGKSIPRNGPLENVEVTWKFEPKVDNTKVNWAKASEFLAGMRMLTDKEGNATLTLRALPCPDPEGNLWLSKHHSVRASGRFVSAQMVNPLTTSPLSMLPGFFEIVTGGRKTYSTLDYSWHERDENEDGVPDRLQPYD